MSKRKERRASDAQIQEVLLLGLAKVAPQVLFSVIFMGMLIAYFAYNSAPTTYIVTWLVVLFGVSTGRFLTTRFLSKDKTIPIKYKVFLISSVTFFAGIAHSLGLLFFPYLSFSERAVQTLMHIGFAAGSIPSTGGYKPFYLWFTSSTLPPLAIAWIAYPLPEVDHLLQLVIATMVISFYIFDSHLAKNYFNFYESSYNTGKQLKSAKGDLEASNKRLATALDDAVKASESKTRFLAAASHDLRQPIHTLSLFGAALSLRKLDTKTKQITERMTAAIKNLADQMDGLLDISKLDAGVVSMNERSFDLGALAQQISNAFQPIAEENGLELILDNPYPYCIVRSDSQQLSRLIQNIVANAIKYTDQGSVTISLKDLVEDWELTITDTGCGISDDEKEKIFDEFYQVGNREPDCELGLGLGLAIVRRLCTILDIKLVLQSELNKGSEFILSIHKSDTQEMSLVTTETEADSIAGLDILCVDDDEPVRMAIDALLTEMGCKVRVCANRTSALEEVKNKAPDILICDLRLKGSETGIDVVKQINSAIGRIPTIIVSGETDSESIHMVMAAGLTLLHKPLSAQQLKTEILKIKSA